MPSDQGLDNVSPQGVVSAQRTRLVVAHEARVADNVGGKYGCEATLHNVLPAKEE
jgi:hypothetical protein